MIRARGLAVALIGLIVVPPAFGHGIGARGDLPIPKNFFIWAATLAVVLSFFVAAVMWQTPRVARAATGRLVGGRGVRTLRLAVAPFVRTLALVAAIVVLAAAWGGVNDPNDNIAPVAVYVVFWVGVLWASALFGDVWRMLNPWDSLAMWAGGRIGTAPDPDPADRRLVSSHWPAAAGLLAFQWLELAHPHPSSPRVVAIAITAYSVVLMAAAARWGRVWLQTGEGFTVLFGLAARIAPIGRGQDGRVALRAPFAGLAGVPARRGTAAVVLTVIGGTTFDGVSRSSWYADRTRDLTGWDRGLANTAGLLACIAAVSLAYAVSCWAVARLGHGGWRQTLERFAPTLVPIALAYSVAHYFSLLVFEGQGARRLVSDPFGQGWDLFGTAADRIDYRVIGTTTIALVQTAAIVIGHVASVILAHDRALEDFTQKRATVSQIPMLVMMVALTVTGLTLLLSA